LADDADTATVASGDRPTNAGELRAGKGGAEIISGWFMDADGRQVESLDAGTRSTFCMHVRFHDDVEEPTFVFSLRNGNDERVVVASSETQLGHEHFAAGEEIIVYFGFDNVLAPDRYGVSAQVARRGSGDQWLDNRERFRTIVISATHPLGGAVDLPFHIYLQRDIVPGAVKTQARSSA
jgi:hypothetical protein